MAGLVVIVAILVVVQLLFGWVGSWLSAQRGHSSAAGFCLGFFLSGIGLLIAALLPRSAEEQAREALAIQRAVGALQRHIISGALPTMSRREVLAAAASLPPPENDQMASLIPFWREGQSLYGCVFATDSKGVPTAVLLYNDQLAQMTFPSSKDIAWADQGTVDTRFGKTEGGVISEVCINGRQYHDVRPSELVPGFVRATQETPWINVSFEEPPKELQPAAQGAHQVRENEGEENQTSGKEGGWAEDIRRSLLTLKLLRDDKVIDEEEYLARRRRLLDRLMGENGLEK